MEFEELNDIAYAIMQTRLIDSDEGKLLLQSYVHLENEVNMFPLTETEECRLW